MKRKLMVKYDPKCETPNPALCRSLELELCSVMLIKDPDRNFYMQEERRYCGWDQGVGTGFDN